ncbi:MAG TPA: hypothetical protein VKA83_09260 [Methylomirabilota bacterium]|nr:hypothetical protein [Methylomirabilota bacterium]
MKDIVTELQKAHPGQAREQVEAKARLLAIGFGVRQWAKIQPLPSATLKAGLEKIRADLRQSQIPEVKAPAPVIAPPAVESPLGPMSDEQELHRELDKWDPPIGKDARIRLFKSMFGTDDIEKVDFAACQDAIELFKKVAAKDPAAIMEVNTLLARSAA